MIAGEGLGSGRSGRADPVQAGQVKVNNLGVGAEQPGEVTADDDIYEQYKKRMMLGYKFRPNPLVSDSAWSFCSELVDLWNSLEDFKHIPVSNRSLPVDS